MPVLHGFAWHINPIVLGCKLAVKVDWKADCDFMALCGCKNAHAPVEQYRLMHSAVLTLHLTHCTT